MPHTRTFQELRFERSGGSTTAVHFANPVSGRGERNGDSIGWLRHRGGGQRSAEARAMPAIRHRKAILIRLSRP